MLYLMHWNIKENCHQKAVDKFLSDGAPMPEDCSLKGRFHGPGSCKGWLIVDTENNLTIYEHASEWGELLSWEITPVFLDEQAGIISAKVWKS